MQANAVSYVATKERKPNILSMVWHLTTAELYKTRRRRMSKVLGSILIVGTLLVFGAVGLNAALTQQQSVESFLPPSCANFGNNTLNIPCLNHKPTQAELAKATQLKQERVQAFTAPLVFPDSANPITVVLSMFGLILLIILVGSNAGGEYSTGTIRQLYVRGPSRIQFLLAKIFAALLYILIGTAIVLLISLLGYLLVGILGLPAPAAISFPDGLKTFAILVLPQMAGLFVYVMMAFFLGTVGRSSAAGIAGAIAWSFLETVVATGINIYAVTQRMGHASQSTLTTIITSIPHYLIGPNIDTLKSIGNTIGGPDSATITRAIIVLAVYAAVFIGISCWATIQRDVTN